MYAILYEKMLEMVYTEIKILPTFIHPCVVPNKEVVIFIKIKGVIQPKIKNDLVNIPLVPSHAIIA